MIENEFKFIVNKSKFDEMLYYAINNFKFISSVLQINYYFDDDIFSLSNNETTLRVRQINENLELQKKIRIKKHNNLFTSEEKNEKITSLPKMIEDKYHFRGSLTTSRKSFFSSNNARIDLDENFYLGNNDYEVEVEISDFETIDKKFITEQLNLNCNDTKAIGKSTRFFYEYKKIFRSEKIHE